MPKTEQLIEALNHPLWVSHQIGDEYTMDGKPGWKIAYYPIFEDGKTGTLYAEPRALVEKSIAGGIDFREVPLRYLTKLPDNLLVHNQAGLVDKVVIIPKDQISVIRTP